MKQAITLALVGLTVSGTAFAGAVPPRNLPDAGASLLLLGIGLSTLGLLRKFKR